MKKDLLKEYAALRDALVEERKQIETRLEEIDRALGETGFPGGRFGIGGRRIRNEMSLKEAVIKVTSVQPLNKEEILAEIHKLGYRFSASNPINSLNVVLYGKNPKFKNEGGRFSPPAVASQSEEKSKRK